MEPVMRLMLAALLLVLVAACSPRGPGNHDMVGDNQESLAALAEDGLDLSKPQPFYFAVLVDGEDDAQALAQALIARDFEVQVEKANGGIWQLWASKTFVPTLAAMDATELEVVAAADAHDGYYEGWDVDE
jgi:hypothetical protein